MAHIAPSIPFRKLPREGYFFVGNEFTDIYAPIVGPFATMIYDALCRNSYGNPTVEYSVRDLARGMSPASAARATQILEIVGLIKRLPTNGSRKSVCQLFDVKALAESHGAMRAPKSNRFQLPAPAVDGLNAQIKTVRQNQQGKARTRAISTSKPDVEIASRSGFHSLFSVSQRDVNVSHLIRKRSTRETQMGTHLLQEEERNEKILSPTPFHWREAQLPKNLPDEEEPLDLVKWARDLFNGVIDDMRAYLLDTNKPPNSNLANGYADWTKFGFNGLAVEAAEWRGEKLALVLSARDPVAARSGLEKYRQKWDESLRKWFGCKVYFDLRDPTRGRRPNAKKC